MTAKEVLSQALLLDMEIDNKVQQVFQLRNRATKVNAVITGMPGCPIKNNDGFAGVIAKIVDLENDINESIDRLVDLKKAIISCIEQMPTQEYRVILSKKYVNGLSWEQIAVDMNYHIRYVMKLHHAALNEIDEIMPAKMKEDTKRHFLTSLDSDIM